MDLLLSAGLLITLVKIYTFTRIMYYSNMTWFYFPQQTQAGIYYPNTKTTAVYRSYTPIHFLKTNKPVVTGIH